MELFETIFSIENIIATAGLLTALGVIIVQAKKIRAWLSEPTNERIEDLKGLTCKEISAIKKRLDNLEDNDLKQIVINPYMPLSERVAAGEVYVNKRGLNGDIKTRHELNIKNYKNNLSSRSIDKTG